MAASKRLALDASLLVALGAVLYSARLSLRSPDDWPSASRHASSYGAGLALSAGWLPLLSCRRPPQGSGRGGGPACCLHGC